MSTYAQFDAAGNQFQIASTTGWGNFGRWVDTLGANDYPLLSALIEDGECQDLPGLTLEIEVALENGAPSPDDEDIGQSLFSALLQSKAAEILLITNGVAADTGDDNDAAAPPPP